MKSRLCILETIKPLKMILDSAMASKIKNIDPKIISLFYPKDGFHPKKLHGLLEEPNPLRKENLYKSDLRKFRCFCVLVYI